MMFPKYEGSIDDTVALWAHLSKVDEFCKLLKEKLGIIDGK